MDPWSAAVGKHSSQSPDRPAIPLPAVHRDALFDHLMETLDVRRDILGPAEEDQPEVAERETLRYLHLHRLLVDLGQRRGGAVELRQSPAELRETFLQLLIDASLIRHTGRPGDRERAQIVASASTRVLRAVEMTAAGLPVDYIDP